MRKIPIPVDTTRLNLVRVAAPRPRLSGITDEGEAEPTTAELAEIEREWPLIAAELDLLDAEIAVLSAEGRASKLDRRRVRRAERRVLEVSRELAAEGVTTPTDQAVA